MEGMEVSNAQHHFQAKMEGSGGQQEKRLRPNPEQFLRCPRCDSTNTKFCYYNNYSLTQPRYFCKGCRRYWTQGGSLRNVPVGGGCRKNKRSTTTNTNSNSSAAAATSTSAASASSSSTSSNNYYNSKKSSQLFPPAMPLMPMLPMPPLSYDPNDLSLVFANLQNHDIGSSFINVPSVNPSSNTAGFLDILRNGYYNGFGTVGDEVDQGSGGGGGGGGEGVMLPFDGGVMNSSTASTATTTTHEAVVTTATAAATVASGHAVPVWPQVGGDDGGHGNGNLAVDPVLRDYWNGVGNSSSNWHGLINSSLM